jgi:ABC-2 type transport system ATP-binding protein
MANPVAEIKGVTKNFTTPTGLLTAIADLSTTILDAQITALIGPDGAGKTTFMRLMAGLLLPSQGAIRVLGQNTAHHLTELRQQIGYMPQSFGLYEELTVQENLTLYANLQGLDDAERQQRSKELLHFTGLEPFQTRRAGKLSGGMKQKLSLASTLIRPPRLLLLDEPSVGVDPLSRRELWAMVRALATQGMAVLWSTAYLDEAERSDGVLVLDHGQKIYDGAPEGFVAPMKGRSFILSTSQAKLRSLQRQVLKHDSIIDAVLRGQTLRLVTAEGMEKRCLEDLIGKEGKGDEIMIKPVRPRLEDAYMAVLRTQQRKDLTENKIKLTANYTAQKTKRVPIQVKALTRRFGSFTAVDRVSFSVQRGEVSKYSRVFCHPLKGRLL